MQKFILSMALMLILSSCVKIGFDTYPKNEKGVLILNTDWSDSKLDLTKKDYIVNIIGDTLISFTDPKNDLPSLKEGNYKLVVYNNTKKVIVENDIATIEEVAPGIIHANPDDFLFGSADFSVNAMDSIYLNVKMMPGTGSLSLIFDIEGLDIAEVANLNSRMNGIANKINLSTGEIISGSNASIVPEFRIENGKLVTNLNIFGIDPDSEQTIELEFTLQDGTIVTLPPMDLSELLKNFNTSKRDGLILENTLTFTSEEGKFIATIGAWKTSDKNNIILQ